MKTSKNKPSAVYLRYSLSYRDLEGIMLALGVKVDHTTIYRWVQKYAPGLDKRNLYLRPAPRLRRAGVGTVCKLLNLRLNQPVGMVRC